MSDETICPKCGYQNPPYRVKCKNCDAPLPKAPATVTKKPDLGERYRNALEEYPGFFLQIERIWQLIRDNIAGPVTSFEEVCNLHVGEKEADIALTILIELGRIENLGENRIRILDNTPITEFSPQDLKPAEPRESYGKICMIHVRGGDAQVLSQVHGKITSSVFSLFETFLAPIEGSNYASTTGNPVTGEMTISFRTKPISAQEFEFFDTQVNEICANHAQEYQR
jgi:hypothetical protein